MPVPTTVLWPLKPQTRGKHLVLRGYLDAWFPIMASSNRRILFVDGFAGPGEYKGGEDGSPLIALKAIQEHTAKRSFKGEIKFLFIEAKADRAKHLKNLVEKIRPELPKSVEFDVIDGEFENCLNQILNYLDEQKKTLAPALVMVDPFGVKGVSMTTFGRILSHPKCEVYVSFMYEAINMRKDLPEFEKHLDRLFGCVEWRECKSIGDSDIKKKFLYDLYESQLKKHGAKYVLRFELFEGNRLVYAIFFATQNLTGCDKMKAAMWKVAPFGEFAFFGSKSNQLIFGVSAPNTDPLASQLTEQFTNRDFVPIEEVTDFVRSDLTDYHSGQLKKHTLVPMEEACKIEVDPSTRNRRKSYPDGCMIRFI